VLFHSLKYTEEMDRDRVLIFCDHLGRFYSERYGLPPVAGRLIGYLYVCEPAQQSINEISDFLLTSRSAVNNAVKMLETQKLVHRTRPAGTRADLIGLNPLGWENLGFDPSEYLQMASLGREGLSLLSDAGPERRQAIEVVISLNEFLAERLPQLYEEWNTFHQESLDSKKKKGE
jgi:DNA-binding MarR family transcriptional regulator